MSQHTPGPWAIRDECNGTIPIDAWDGQESTEIARVSEDNLRSGNAEQQSNARLIALAPTMLDCLSHIWEVYGKQLKLNDVVMIETIMKQAEGN